MFYDLCMCLRGLKSDDCSREWFKYGTSMQHDCGTAIMTGKGEKVGGSNEQLYF